MKYKYCKSIEEIENYASAAADNFIGWDIHHRLETHNSDGERRIVDLSRAELLALGTYYDRPASELIFLKHGDHTRLHNQQRTPETKAKLSAAHRGKHFSDKTRAKIGAASRDRHPSEETRAKLREAAKHRAPMSEATRVKLSAARRGKCHSEESRAKMREAWKLRLSKTSAN